MKDEESRRQYMNYKDPVTLVQDYLEQLHKHVMETLKRRFTSTIIQNTRIHYILTVPAIFSDLAKHRMELAARKAGIGGTNSSLELLSEPESAALYCLKIMQNRMLQIKVGDKMVICDAGGGTVDLISYELKQIVDVFRLEECSTATGG